jgi:hypothetical protein
MYFGKNGLDGAERFFRLLFIHVWQYTMADTRRHERR